MALSSAAMRTEWFEYECDKRLDLLETGILGRSPVRIIDSWEPAWRAFEAVMLFHGYGLASNVGSYNCRDIAGSTSRSLHAYKLALDIDAPSNWVQRDRKGQGTDWTRCQVTQIQCEAVEAIRFNNGEQVFRSGALAFNTPDPMHYQGSASKAGVASGVNGSTVAGSPEQEDNMWPQLGDVDDSTVRNFRVEHWQLILARLEGFVYVDGNTRTVIEEAGMTRGVYDDDTKTLVAKHTDTNGEGIGPREEAQLDPHVPTTEPSGFAEVETTILLKNAGG